MIGLLLLLIALLFPRPVSAIYAPTSVDNNKFGIHIADLNDISDTQPLVDSSGGDWGYVTLVASDNDRDSGRWQRIFDQMRRLHLIPIVRIATHVEKDAWAKPDPVHFDELVSFFNGLNWPIQNKYIVLYNEPNHANEWGNSIDPEEYASDFVLLAQKFKSASDDFFVLPAGLDASAASDGQSLDEAEYLRRMVEAKPEILNLMDGWTSHSYPNPGFTASPYNTGRGSLWTFSWELSLLQELGETKNLPVFIAETGWMHNRGKYPKPYGLSPDTVGNYLKIAAQTVWSDQRIVAVTPFVFSYQDVPFDTFSWKQLGNNGYYSQYDAYQSIGKINGKPIQREEYLLSSSILPATLVSNSSYTLTSQMTNNGEGIFDQNNGYDISIQEANNAFPLVVDPVDILEPTQTEALTIHIKTPATPGVYHVALNVTHLNNSYVLQIADIQVVPPPALTITSQLGWRSTNTADNVTVLLYDNNVVLHKATDLEMRNGLVNVQGLSNIVPGKKYRVVMLVPYYLPRQLIMAFGPRNTTASMKRFLPFDLNLDGKFTLSDIWTLLLHPPKDMLKLFVGP